MKPIHKFNGGLGATLCHSCSVIISIGLTEDLYCERCKCKDCSQSLENCTYIEDTLNMKQETIEEYYLSFIKNMLDYNNNALAIRLMEKYYHAKKEQDE